MRAFVIRPFGVKEGVDFDAVAEALIDPALRAQGDRITGRDTGEVVKAGNIRTDMFEQILAADLVVADISIHNANVFYELGIRHALRDKRTVLIRSTVKGHDVPFDLKTDRYLKYDNAKPKKSVKALTKVIHETIASTDADSPVFQLLPALKPVDPKTIVVVPKAFSEEVAHAAANGDKGRLRLLAEEVDGLPWEIAGRREVGSAQFMLRDWGQAKESLEAVINLYPNDVQANSLLGTVYHRLEDFTRSSQALDRVLDSREPSTYERAEARALRARNHKSRWEQEYRTFPAGITRQQAALRSGHLTACAQEYSNSFREDRNHFYAGVNALAMNRIIVGLAEAHPTVWQERHEGVDGQEVADEAARTLRSLKRRGDTLASGVELSVESGIERLTREKSAELIWAKVSRADLTFLTSNAGRAAQGYREALVGAKDFVKASARGQIERYAELGLFPENTAAALDAIPAHEMKSEEQPAVLVFTGHRIDAPDRQAPRFPADQEVTARGWIREALKNELETSGDRRVLAISGGASGGDILFHEACGELGIESRMFLAIPPKKYIAESVADGGPDWVRRFHDLQEETTTQVLYETKRLPKWLRSREGYGIWQRSNLWLLHSAFAIGSRVTLMALWNHSAGDGPGGTEDMVERAKARGARVVILDARRLVE